MFKTVQFLMSASYYHILGINSKTSLQGLKSAYRAKVKIYHPDISDLPDAEEKFIALTEAYEYFLKKFDHIANLKDNKELGDEIIFWHQVNREWIDAQMDKVRTQAARQAKMNFEDFKKTKTYKTTRMLHSYLDYFTLTVGLFIIIFAIIGLRQQVLLEEFDFGSGFAFGCITIIGVVMFIFSLEKIKDHDFS